MHRVILHGVNFKYLGLALFHMNRFKEAVVPLAIADSLFQDDWGNRLDPELSMRYGETLGKCRETEKAMKVLGEIERQMMPDTLMLYRLAFLRGNAVKRWINGNKRCVIIGEPIS